MNTEVQAYGLWALVIINVAVFAIFALSFTRPRSVRDWRTFGAFSAFLVALFTETGPYAILRHPQYAAFFLILLGFLFQWPTLLTLLMFPILVAMYLRLAQREENEAMAAFGEAYTHYAAATPAFFPRWPGTNPDPRSQT